MRLEELCLLLLGASSLQFFSEEMETYQEAKGFLQKQLSYKSKLGGESLLVLEHEVGDLPFGFEGRAADQISLFESWGSSTLSS